jgi:methyltransferase (TIGR00027 family)
MKADRPSRTAQFVALGRAMADIGLSRVPGFSDPTARHFLNEKGKHSFAKVEAAVGSGEQRWRVEAARSMSNLMALRTMAIDTAVRAAITGGARQLVILGAGYDGRAWRMRELTGVKVFEVDHPATQGEKRSRVNALPEPAGIVSFVPIDFERDSLDGVLERAGHDKTAPTCWIWEGVVMYLTRDAMRGTLSAVARRSARGSILIVNYHTTHRRFLARIIFRLIGEPQISAWSPPEMAADLEAAGFIVRDDSSMARWNTAFANGEANIERASYMRIAVAERS